MSWVASIATLGLLLALGGFPWRLRGERGRTASLVRAFLAGAVALHLSFELLAVAGLRWSLVPLLGVAAAVQAVTWRWRDRLRPAPVVAPTWGDGVALTALGIFAALAWRLEAVTPDFVYHWGSKARRFAHAGGVDVDFLSLNSAFRLQPQYPCLTIDLAAMPGALFGSGSIAASLVPSLAAFALMPLLARDLLARTGAGTRVRAGLLAAWTLVIARFAIGHRMGGQADLLIALAVVAALPALLEPRATTATRDLALAAAVAAAAKTEGLAIALLLVAVHSAQVAVASLRSGEAIRHLRSRVSLPFLAVAISAAPWLLRNARHGLAGDDLLGGYRWERATTAVVEIARWLAASPATEWSIWPVAALAAIPALLLHRRTRFVGVLAAGMLALDVVAYSGGAPEVPRWVATSFPRLLFHVVPLVLLAVAVELARTMPGARSDSDTVPAASAEPGRADRSARLNR